MNWLLRRDRLWASAAVVVAVLLSASAWTLLIGPQREETVNAEQQTADAQALTVVEQRKLDKLKKDNERRDTFIAELTANRRALPADAATADLLRELQAAGAEAGVSVVTLSAGNPVELQAPGARVASMAITINATGSLAALQTFLTQIQRIQPRAMLVHDVGFAPAQSEGSIVDEARLTVSAQVFVSIQSTSGTPSSAAPATD